MFLLVFILVLAGCGSGGGGSSSNPIPSPTPTPTNPTQPGSPTPTPNPTPEIATWKIVGQANFYDSEPLALAVYNGHPYVAFGSDPETHQVAKGNVWFYNGSKWDTVAGFFTTGEAKAVSLAVDNLGKPYVAYCDVANGNKVTVQTINTDYYYPSWEVIGEIGISDVNYPCTAIAIDDITGTVYVAYRDAYNSNKLTIKSYNGGGWLSYTGISNGEAKYISLAIDNSIPYVAYQDKGWDSSYKAMVNRFDGTYWRKVGSSYIDVSNTMALDISLAVYNDTPYVAYRDANSNSYVKKFNGSNWVTLGGDSFGSFSNNAIYLSLCVYNGIPYIAFRGNGANVMKYDGSSWQAVGASPISEGTVMHVFLDIDNGVPYATFRDSFSTVVKKFN